MTQHHKYQSAKGFTIIELTLSMAFIGLLLLGIAMLTLQIGSIYNKGLTLRSVNEAGQLVSNDMQRTFNSALLTNAALLVSNTPSTGGRLCFDTTVYAWNLGSNLNATGFNTRDNGSKDIRLVKFISGSGPGFYCTQVSGAYPNVPNAAIDLLTNGDSNLSVHSLEINTDPLTGQIGLPVQNDDSQRMYQISITIGTDEALINSNGCETPPSVVDDEYCAVNQFTFTARSGNREIGS